MNMRVKQMTRWTLGDMLPSWGIFFGVYALVILAVTVAIVWNIGGIGVGTKSVGIGSGTIYLFIAGLIMFPTYLGVGFANGVSRRSVFFSFGICAAVFSAMTAIGEMLLSIPLYLLTGNEIRTFMQLPGLASGSAQWVYWAVSLLLVFCGNLMTSMLGFTISGGYYRMNRMARLVVSILVPLLLLIGIPVVWVQLLTEAARQALWDSMIWPVVQFFTSSAVNQMLVYLAAAVVFGACVWLLLRKAPVRHGK